LTDRTGTNRRPRGRFAAATLALGVALAGCGTGHSAAPSATPAQSSASTPAASPPSTPVQITYWAGHSSGALHKAVVAEVAQFNATHPTIHVTFDATGASVHGLAAFEAGKAPNVGMINHAVLGQLVSAHAILDLKTYIDGASGLSASQISADYYPAVWADMQTGAHQYLMPLEKKALTVIYYNESLFKQAGITAAPATWQQVAADAQKITALGSGDHGIAWTPSLRPFFDMVISDGGAVFTTQTNRQTFSLNNAGALAALNLLRGLVASGDMILTTGYGYQQDFGVGKIGILIDASAGYTYDNGSVGGKFVVGGASAPSGSSGHSSAMMNGESLAMFNTGTAAQQAASWTFIKYLSSPSTNTYWDQHTNYLPLGPAAYTLMKPYYAKNTAEAATYSTPSGWWFAPRSPNYAAAYTALTGILDQALNGKIQPQQALIEMDTQGTQYLSGKVRG